MNSSTTGSTDTKPDVGDGGLTDHIAGYISNYVAASATSDVQVHAARAFANWFACAIAGSQDESVTKLLAVLDAASTDQRASVLGRGRQLGVANAAFANAYASTVLDFDDMHIPSLIHPTGPVVAAAMAVAESRKAVGQALLDAIHIGIEVELHIGECLFPDHYDTGWHSTATVGVLGAAAAASALLGLNKVQTAQSLAMAATQAGGLRAMLPNDCKNLNVAKAAHGGVFAAQLAEQGITSAPAIFDERFGYFSVFEPREGYGEKIRSLGKHDLISGITLKPYPCGVVIHPVIDACIAISRRAGFDAKAVRAIDISIHPRTAVLADKQHPPSPITSRFSLQHAAALALTRSSGNLDTFDSADIDDPELVRLRESMSVYRMPEMLTTQARIVVDLGAMGRMEEYVAQPSGSVENPLTTEQLRDKFVQLCRRGMDTATADRMFGQCLSLAEVRDLSVFTIV